MGKFDDVVALFAPQADKAAEKKVRGFAVRGVLVPVLHANRVNGHSMGDVTMEELGSPIVLARNKDGTVKLRDGKPVYQPRPSIRKFGGMLFDGVNNRLAEYVTATQEAKPDAYAASVSEATELGIKVTAKDTRDLQTALTAYELSKVAEEAAAGVTSIGSAHPAAAAA